MENAPEAPAAAPAESEATPNTNPEPQAAPDMHGFTSEQLADMQKFFQANGGYDKVKSKISNPTPAPVEEQKPAEPAQPAARPQEVKYDIPDDALKMKEYFARRYFTDLSTEDKYSGIADYLTNGDAIREMNSLGINVFYPDGSIDEKRLTQFLDLKAQTVPAKQSGATPEASAAPTVDYVPVEGDKITDLNQAYAIIRQDAQLKSRGMAGHPNAKIAEDFIKNSYKAGK